MFSVGTNFLRLASTVRFPEVMGGRTAVRQVIRSRIPPVSRQFHSGRAPIPPEEVARAIRDFGIDTWTEVGKIKSILFPKYIVRAKGSYLFDNEGKRYWDMSSQLMAINGMHGDPYVIKKICEQVKKVAFTVHPTEAHARALLTLRRFIGDYSFYICTGGANAVAAGLQIARQATGKKIILVDGPTYHGGNKGGLEVSVGDIREQHVSSGVPADIVRVLGINSSSFSSRPTGDYIAYLENVINDVGAHKIAVKLSETIVGSNGLLIPPQDFLPKEAELLKKKGILNFKDSVMDGIGRTGKNMAYQHYGIEPDIICTGKGAGLPMMPNGVTGIKPFVKEKLKGQVLYVGETCAKHPIVCAAITANLERIEKMGWVENANKIGKNIGPFMEELKASHTSVKEFRGMGLFWKIILQSDSEGASPTPEQINAVEKRLLELGVLADMRGGGIMFAPPLSCTADEVEHSILTVLNKALLEADRLMKGISEE